MRLHAVVSNWISTPYIYESVVSNMSSIDIIFSFLNVVSERCRIWVDYSDVVYLWTNMTYALGYSRLILYIMDSHYIKQEIHWGDCAIDLANVAVLTLAGSFTYCVESAIIPDLRDTVSRKSSKESTARLLAEKLYHHNWEATFLD